MALNKSKLETSLEAWMNGKDDYDTALGSIKSFADAYEDYSEDAQDPDGGPFISANKQGLINELSSMAPGLSASEGAVLFEDAIYTYWVGGVFTSGGVISSITKGPLKDALEVIFENLDDSVAEKADQISTALDSATRTVIVATGDDPGPIS